MCRFLSLLHDMPCSVLGSILTGAFNKVFINTGAATGTVVLSSVTPVNASVNLGGITTLLVDGPAGEEGTACHDCACGQNVGVKTVRLLFIPHKGCTA